MTFLKQCVLGLLLVFGLSIAACSGAGCKTDEPPIYPDPGKPAAEPHRGIQE